MKYVRLAVIFVQYSAYTNKGDVSTRCVWKFAN